MPKNNELGLTGAGVEPVEIPEIEKAISKYERLKAARSEASPPEKAAKIVLVSLLHEHIEELPTNRDGARFYRSDGKDYILDEKLRIRAVEENPVDDE